MSELIKPVFGIDPGNVESAYCVYFPDTHSIGEFGKVPNNELRRILKTRLAWDHLYAVEMVASYGMPVGADIFETVLWAGRFMQIVEHADREIHKVYRKDVKLNLLGRTSGNDAQVRHTVMSLFRPTGGGKTPVVGTKAKPGPLYGVKADVWAALAVCLTAHDMVQRKTHAAPHALAKAG